MNFNNNNNKFLSLAYGCQDNIAIIRKFDINGISITNLRKDRACYDSVYWKQVMSLDEFCRVLEYLLVANSVDVIAGEFNYDLSKVLSNKLLDHMILYNQVVNEPTDTSGSQIDHVYIKSALLEEFHTKAIVRIVFWKNEVDFTVSRE